MKQCQMVFNQEIVNKVVTKKMWKSFTNKEYKFVIGLCNQRYPFTEKQNKWFTEIVNKTLTSV